MSPFRAATAHVSPHYLNPTDTLRKTLSLIHRAAKNHTSLLTFPESHLPGFPYWPALRAPTSNHALFKRFVQASVYADGEEILAIRRAAREAGVMVSLGLSERGRGSVGRVWNSNLLIGRDGGVLALHRKLVPTFFEKMVWGNGDAGGLRVVEDSTGRDGLDDGGVRARVGVLVCGENTNPLARFALMAQGETVHISSWPAVWPTRALGGEGVGKGQGRNYDNIAANRMRAAAHCFEAKCFGVMSSGVLDEEAIRICSEGADEPESVRRTLEASPRGASLFLDPTGALLPGFTIDEEGNRKDVEFLQHEEGILYADMNLEDCIEGKQYHDVVGGYQRYDVFDLKVRRERKDPVTFIDDFGPEKGGEEDLLFKDSDDPLAR